MAQDKTPHVADGPSQEDVAQVMDKYASERNKRVRPEGMAQYIDLSKSQKFGAYFRDPWVDPSIPPERPKITSSRVLILGGGFGALLYAVRFIQAGFSAEDIILVDSAGGFGGTWYWNRYPGLMCDVESYIYMPLLEETGHMPGHRYAYGPELRRHADNIGEKWGLTKNAIFNSTIKEARWDDSTSQWKTRIALDRFAGEQLTISSDFLVIAAGVLNIPKIPDIAGLGDYEGHCFHTSRWDYGYTGGSPEDPTLEKLKDKSVAIIGTGATAVQAVPALAKHAKELYVIQRTPSAVDERGQHPTDKQWWEKNVATRAGWQRERQDNFSATMSNLSNKPAVDMVNDRWSKFETYSALIGGSASVGLTMEALPQYLASMHALDLPRQERIRARVDSVVTDSDTATSLKAWYPGWCKRPTFHDDYLEAFNRPNVHLVDTKGAGVDRLTKHTIVAGGEEHAIDLLIMSTGFNPPSVGDPAARAGVHVTGRGGQTLADKWAAGVGTLHGVLSRGFPNMFLSGPSQAGVGANFTNVLDVLARHSAHVMAACAQRAKEGGCARFVVEPSQEGEDEWSARIAGQALGLATLAGCTPSYINNESEIDREMSPEEQYKSARGAFWTAGVLDFQRIVKEWEDKGQLQGLEVKLI